MLTVVTAPSCFAVHRLDDGRWEILSSDDDYRRPPWHRVTVIAAANLLTPRHFGHASAPHLRRNCAVIAPARQ